MGFIWLGIVLIVLGIVLSAFGLFPAGPLVNVGWLLVVVGIILAVLSFLGGPRVRTY